MSQTELAKLAGVSIETVRQWRQAGCPCETVRGRPRFVVSKVWDWRVDRARTDGRPPLRQDAETRFAAAKADMQELRLARERGDLVPVADFRDAVTRSHQRVRDGLRLLPIRAGPRMTGITETAKAVATLQEEVLVILSELRQG